MSIHLKLFNIQLMNKINKDSLNNFENIYNIPIEYQQYAAKYSIFHKQKFYPGNINNFIYKDIYHDYMELGHPIIDSIKIISLKSNDNKVFDSSITSNLQATIVTEDNKIYYIYLTSYISENGIIYKVLDIQEK